VSAAVSYGTECSDFFLLGERFRRGAIRVTTDLQPEDLWSLARGQDRHLESRTFEVVEGRAAFDLIGTDLGVAKVLSDAVFAVLRREQLTGWRSAPASIRTRDGRTIHGYSLLVVCGRSGPFEDRYSERVQLPALAAGGAAMPGLKGMCFDPHTWDGSDVFTPDGSAAVVVTARAGVALERARLTNIALTRLSEIEQIVVGH
jgi:hypothetical protein